MNNICSGLPSAKMDEAWSVDALSKLRDRVDVARHLARHGAAADELVGDLAGGDAGHLSGQEPGARPQHRRHLPDDPQLRARRHHAGEVQLHAHRHSAQRHRAGPRPRRATASSCTRAREAGSAADDRRQGRRRHVLGAHHLFPRAGRAGGRGIQGEDGLPSAGSGRAEGHPAGAASMRCSARPTG